MIVEYVRYQIEPARAAEFLAAYHQAAVSLVASPHCHGYELTQCTEEPESFVLRILWDSLEGHMQGFRKSEEFKPFFAAVKPFYGAIQEMHHYQLTELQWQRAAG